MNGPTPPPVAELERDRRGSIALDQWRGLALVLVLISHGFFFTGRVDGIGRVGVNLFFFISGILVFRTLTRTRAVNEWDRTRSFWWRRFRRLYPALIAYLVLMLAPMWWLQRFPNLPEWRDFHLYLSQLWVALAYLANYIGGLGMPVGHLWSLGCEMQFYLVAPVIYLAGGRTDRRRMTVFGGLLLLLAGLGAVEPAVPVVLTHFNWVTTTPWKYHFEFAVWPMMAGFFCEYRRDWFSHVPGKMINLILGSSVAICGICLGLMLMGQEMKLPVIGAGAVLLLPCLLAYVHGRPLVGRPGHTLRWLGERTYSIYLWQQPLTICDFMPTYLHPAGALVAVAVGAASFRLFEHPFLSVNRQKQESAR